MLYWFLTVSCNIPLPQQKIVAFNENRLVQHGLEIFVEIVVKNRVFMFLYVSLDILVSNMQYFF